MMCILMLLGIMAFSLNSLMGEKNRFIYAHSHSLLMDMAAFEISTLVYANLGETLSDPSNELFKDIVVTKPSDFPMDISSSIPGEFPFLKSQNLPPIEFKATLTIKNPKAIETNIWKDPWEKTFSVSLDIYIQTGRGFWQKNQKHYHFSRPAKVLAMAVPLLSKFTLFLKNPEHTNESEAGYNCMTNTINGEVLAPNDTIHGVEAPIVFYNSPKNRYVNLYEAGHIFLGGDSPLELHLTSGGMDESGEFFLFYPISKPEIGPFLTQENNFPTSFPTEINFSSPGGSGWMGIRHAIFGFYDQDEQTPPQDMNIQGSLGLFFDGIDGRTMDSSCLHLSGDMLDPSPGLIVGEVYRLYPRYSGLVLDVNKDGKNDGMLSLLKTPAHYDSVIEKLFFWDLVALPLVFSSSELGYYQLENSLTMEKVFSDKTTYYNYSSQIMCESYNMSIDYLTNDEEVIPPAGKYEELLEATGNTADFEDPYYVDPKNYQVKLSHASQFSVDLTSVNLEELFHNRVVETVNDAKEFKRRYLHSKQLDLSGKTVRILNGDLQLPTELEVINPGVLMVKGDIRVMGDIITDNDEMLFSLVSETGSILLEGASPLIEAYLVSLNETVRPTSETEVNIFGGIALNSLMPSDWKRGGKIHFNKEFDFTQPGCEKNYAVHIADYYDKWNVQSNQ